MTIVVCASILLILVHPLNPQLQLAMPKVKKGRRSHYSFSRVKNYERTWQGHVKESTSPEVNSDASLQSLCVPSLPSTLSKWHIVKTESNIELSYLQGSAPITVKYSVMIKDDLRWNVRVYGKLVSEHNAIFNELPHSIRCADEITMICRYIEKLFICKGNNDDDFVEIVKKRGGVIKTLDLVSAYYFPSTNSVHHTMCPLLRNDSGKCTHCQKYRANLRALKSREKRSEGSENSKTCHNSHTNYRYLDGNQLQDRLKSVQVAKKKVERTVCMLKEKLHSLIDNDGMEFMEDEDSDINALMAEVSEEVKARNYFQKVFWEQQRKYNELCDKRRMRWHPLMIRFALNLKYLSSSAFRAVGNYIALPSSRTLNDYTHVFSVEEGVNYNLIERLKEDMKFDTCDDSEKLISIMFDEMKIKSGLVFNKVSGRMAGFVDLGKINSELDALLYSLETSTDIKSDKLAGSMLVLMVRLLRRPSFTFPIAQFPTASLSGHKLYPIVWDVVEAMELNGFKVMTICCDGLSANRRFFHIGKDVSLKIPYKTTNPFDRIRSIFYFCDVPHLVKTARNCFSNSFAHSHTRKLKVRFSSSIIAS